MITTSANKKANIRQTTDADILSTSGQPVIATYEIDSVAGQTMVPNTGNLPFLINTANRENFELFIDGRLFRYGADNDYTFAEVDGNGYSSKIQLNTPIYGVVNIIAVKRGLKKEAEFGVDQRFLDLYDVSAASFQGFVDESSKLSAVNGTPSTGQFRSSITNRTSIPDIANDLRVRMGVERISVQQIYEVQSESGPNGERVFGVLNDDRGLIRFVGSWYTSINDSAGPNTRTATSGDFIEVTFYGTGLNMLSYQDATNRSYSVSVDGGVAVAYNNTGSAALNSRYYNQNTLFPLISGLSLGLHTVKISTTSSNLLIISGFEILNETTTLNVRPGIAYQNSKKLILSASQTPAYNSSFDSILRDGASVASLGSRGGRVVVYQKADGTIGKAATETDSTAKYLSNADHTNEEVARAYYPREFGCNRGDDFSSLTTGSISDNRAFTLDDGTTTLVGQGVAIQTIFGNESVTPYGASNYITLTFIGTGLDLVIGNDTGTHNAALSIDGTSVGSFINELPAKYVVKKICSGLKYGTHTFRIALVSGTNFRISKFIVYQPKKPSIPSGAVELADYNVMADFVANATAGADTIASGVLRKASTRELTYIGTWAALLNATQPTGWNVSASANSGSLKYTFFGTGFDFRFSQGPGGGTWTVAVDGSTSLSSYSTSYYGAGISSFTAATGTLVTNTTSTAGCGVSVSGLTLGVHTITITNTVASGTQLFVNGFDIITPIHSHRSNLYGDLQNTLSVGSCAISDNRKISAIKEALPTQKAWAQAVGISTTASTTSTVYIPCPDMSVTVKTSGGRVMVAYSLSSQNNTTNRTTYTQVYVDGVAVGVEHVSAQTPSIATQTIVNQDTIMLSLPAGVHKVDLYWHTDGTSTMQVSGTSRSLLVVEL